MCERPKIHVFLGAPPPSSGPASVSEVGAESVDRPPAGWGHLELTWTDGHLRPAADEAGNQSGRSREEGGASGGDATPDRATLDLHDQTNTHQGSAPSEADWTTEASQADTYCNDHKPAQSPEEPRPEEPGPEEPGPEEPRPEEPGPEEPGPEEEDQCSASVHQYLDSCFPAAQPGPEPQPPAVPPLCPRTQYLTTWTLSQALILRGRHSSQSATSPEKTPPPRTPPSTSSGTPELFSPVTPSPGASAELFSQPCSTPRVEEGGVVLQPTTEGVLCSQEAESTTALDSPAKPPDSKRARVSEESRTEVPSNSSTGGLQGPTTPLVRCHTPGVRYSVLVAVVHPCHLKEVQVKSGPSAGTSVPLASIVVIDQSDVEMKVVLWRRAAFWVLTVSPGDILLITGLQVNENRWSGETVLQSTFSSKLLSLGQVTASSPGTPEPRPLQPISSLHS
uniref:Shieldin complex subunit 2 first OB fold domain-containing protein n=1 Tax=Seriola lalandi dorsalis TaxID=1841481 RepID=A0A3B4WMM9_SERLL